MSRAGFGCSQQNWYVFFRKNNPARKFARRSFKELELRGKIGKPPALLVIFKIDVCFRQRIARAAKYGILKFPELEKARGRLISGREQNVGVKKQPIHLARPPVEKLLRTKTEFANRFSRSTVFGLVHGVLEP